MLLPRRRVRERVGKIAGEAHLHLHRAQGGVQMTMFEGLAVDGLELGHEALGMGAVAGADVTPQLHRPGLDRGHGQQAAGLAAGGYPGIARMQSRPRGVGVERHLAAEFLLARIEIGGGSRGINPGQGGQAGV